MSSRDHSAAEAQELFVRYRDQGDGRAFSALYNRLGPRLFRIGVKFFRSRHGDESARALAADAAQETWFLIVTRRSQWDRSRGSFFAWAHTIHFHCLVHLNRRTPPPEGVGFDERATEVPSEDPGPDRLLAASQALEQLPHLLSADEAALLRVYCLVGGSARHAAASLGISHAAVRKRIERIRRKVRHAPALRELLDLLGIGMPDPKEPERHS